MDKIELKPRPFCGGDAKVQQGKYQGLRTFYVSCLGCGARTDLEYAEEIIEDRERAVAALTAKGYEVVNTYFSDKWYSDDAMEERGVVQVPLCYLAKSLENMSLCHTAYFCKGWEDARGCRIEHDAAVAYGLEVLYED